MRIAVGGIGQETNTFSVLRTTLADFDVLRGDECVAGAWWDARRAEGVAPVGTLCAGATPNGPVARDAYERLKGELLERLGRALPVDGVYLDLHGAMEVEGLGDGESDLVAAVRAVVGGGVPVAASLDLHANLAPAVVGAADVLTAYRTAPHRDGPETRRRALALLARCAREGLRPAPALIKVPLLLPGEWAVTDAEPARSLYRLVEEVAGAPGVLDASLLIGCAWTDSPYTSVSVLVIAESDGELARRHAVRLAEAAWARRAEFRPEVETAAPEAAVAAALAAPSGPVFLSDAGDNVTAGGAGDSPLLAGQLLAAGAPDAVVAGIADPAAVAACAAAGVGARVSLRVGGKLDPRGSAPLAVEGAVLGLGPPAPADPPGEPTLAAVRAEGVTLLLTADRRPFTTLGAFRAAGIDPAAHRVVVVKLGYLFPELRRVTARSILALTPGWTDLRVEALPYARVPRPIFPLDRGMEWDAGSAG